VLRILDAEGPPKHMIFHCFSGDAAMVKRCADSGYLMSFAARHVLQRTAAQGRGRRGAA
jgi:TatD DNase family protein